MDFFNSAVEVLQTLVIALGAGLGVWGVINLAFQAFFIMVIVGIYSALVKDLTTATDLHSVVMKLGAYSIILCLSLFKTSSISKSIFNAH